MAKLLIVNANKGDRESAAYFLTMAGHEVVTSADAHSGLCAATARVFDLVVVCLGLPDMPGMTMLRELGSRGVAPVLVSTAFPDVPAKVGSTAEGAAGFFEGILFGDELVRLVERILDKGDTTNSRVATSCNQGDDRVRRAIRLIEQDPKHSCLKRLSSDAKLSESRFRHLFAGCVGVSFSQFCATYRMARASRELLTSMSPVGVIAVGCGFNDLRHFREVFRRRFGLPPQAYRKKYNPTCATLRGDR